jgi:hypothetical protein
MAFSGYGVMTNLEEIPDYGKTRRTGKRDSMWSAAEYTIKKPHNAAQNFASALESAQNKARQSNGGQCIDDANTLNAFDHLKGHVGSATAGGWIGREC